MEYYTLSRYAYWKYYYLILYYKLQEYPASVRGWIVFGSICMLLLVLIVIGNFIRYISAYRFERLIARNRARYYNRMRSVVSQTRTLEPSEISAIMELPKNYKMKERQNRSFIPILKELRKDLGNSLSRQNWLRLLQALKMPAYFESQVLSRKIRKKVQAFKDVADLDATLKEAVASRYLFTKNRKLQMHARLHAARFGTSYPFKVLEEDPNLVFTEEMVVKYHNVLVYRQKNGLTMPNLIRWCNRVPVNDELRIFAVNEIRLFKRKEDCAELLAMLENRLEQEPQLVTADFSAKELAELMGVSQARLMRLFRNSTIFRSADEYLENLRLVRALRLLRDHPQYGIAAVSAEAGYNSVRTLQRRMVEVVGMTPVEFRIMVEK